MKKAKRLKSMKLSSIALSQETRMKLEQLKFTRGESYDSVINRMIAALKSLMEVQDIKDLRNRLLEYEPNQSEG